MSVSIDRDRLVDWASKAISIPSFTGSEEELARFVQATFEELGLQVQWQQVEEGRANVLGTLAGVGGGPSLMFNGHLDTSYSGREPWLRHVPGFQPEPFIRDGRLYGLGISNMKGALACYVEAVRALQDAGVRLRGDVLVAAVCGEIEKTQYGDAQGAEYRGYAAGTRYLVTHGGVADMCLLGEPTEGKVVLGHFGALWLRIRIHGDFIHTAFSEGRRDQNSILRAHRVLEAVQEWIPSWEDDPANAYRGAKAIVNVGAIEGGFGWRVSRTPHHTDLFLDVRVPPTKPMGVARREVLEWVRSLASQFPDYGLEGEVYVTAPGAEIEEGHELVAAIDEAHEGVFGAKPERDVTRWFSDASALTRYGIPTVNYGTSTGLMDVELGENLEIDGLVQTAEVYARAAVRGLRRRMSRTSTRCRRGPAGAGGRRRGRPSGRARAARPRARVVASAEVNVRDFDVIYVYPRRAARACRCWPAGTRSRVPAAARRSRARSATPRPSFDLARRCASRGCRRRRSTTSSSSPSGTTCRSRCRRPERRLGAALGLPTFDVEGAHALQAPHARGRDGTDREGLLPRLPT